MTSAPDYIYPCYFMSPLRTGRNQPYARVRDPLANFELSVAMMMQGYRYADPILNFPPPEDPPRDPEPHPIDPRLRDRMGPRDVVLLTTRPPLHDYLELHRKRITLGHTDIERTVFALMRRDFDYLDRARVTLASRHRAALAPEFADRGDLLFYLAWNPRYQALNAHDGKGWSKTRRDDERTAAYLTRTRLWEGGPELLTVFGMAQRETLVWAHRLRTEFSHLLRDRSFVMAELVPPLDAVERPTSFYEAGAHDWKVEILIEERG